MENTTNAYKAPDDFYTIYRKKAVPIKVTAIKLKNGEPNVIECNAWVYHQPDGIDFILSESPRFFSRKRFVIEPGCKIKFGRKMYDCVSTPTFNRRPIYQVLQTKEVQKTC